MRMGGEERNGEEFICRLPSATGLIGFPPGPVAVTRKLDGKVTAVTPRALATVASGRGTLWGERTG